MELLAGAGSSRWSPAQCWHHHVLKQGALHAQRATPCDSAQVGCSYRSAVAANNISCKAKPWNETAQLSLPYPSMRPPRLSRLSPDRCCSGSALGSFLDSGPCNWQHLRGPCQTLVHFMAGLGTTCRATCSVYICLQP